MTLAGPAVRLVLPSGVDTTPIKPGQRIDVVSGTVMETYRAPKGEAAPGEKGQLFENAPTGQSAPDAGTPPAGKPGS